MLPMKTQLNLAICTVWSESSLSAWRNPASLAIQMHPVKIQIRLQMAQSDLNLHWVHISEGTFSDNKVYMYVEGQDLD